MFSFGVAGFILIAMKRAAKKSWNVKIDRNYKPKISIIIPTYNEANIIQPKLENLIKVNYPKDLIQVIIVDSCSEDQTVFLAGEFAKLHPEMRIQILTQGQREGKSAALNFALKHCNGDVIIVSDADCFWPSDILEKALPFLADPTVGAISGPKILLNSNQTWITRSEAKYLNSMNLIKLGESKIDSTLFFEGGFSAYKKEALTSFDPYNTGSDDCGTVINIIEKGYRSIIIPEARFYSTFVATWKEKTLVKIRRANQLIRVFGKYLRLLVKGDVKKSQKNVIRGVFLYIICPLMFISLIITFMLLLLQAPILIFLFVLFFLFPRLNVYILELIQSYLFLLLSMAMVVFNKKFIKWEKPKDRCFVSEHLLREYKLI